MSDIIPFDKKANQLPAALVDIFADSSAEDLISSGAGFPVISIRGSKWRIKVNGEEHPLINQETGDPMPSIELTIITSQKGLSKIFYEKNYSEGDVEAPDCSSMEGDVPDKNILKPVAPTCQACPNNAWGSRVSESGVESKACGDSKRIAVTFTSNMKNEELGGPMLLRVPAASLKDLSKFARGMAAKGFKPQQISMRVGFDMNASYPKLTFKAVRPLSQEEVGVIAELYQSEEVATMMSTTHEVAAPPKPAEPVSTTVDLEFEAEAPAPAPAAKKKAAPKKAAPKKEEPVAEVAPLDAQLDDVLASLDEMEL